MASLVINSKNGGQSSEGIASGIEIWFH
jgi:hypothetical protein